MAKARAIIKRRKAIQNIRKITRTMELIATARFKKALDRAVEAEAFTRKIAELVADLKSSNAGVGHPLLADRTPVKRTLLLVITSNRGLAGGYNGNVVRLTTRTLDENQIQNVTTHLEVAGKRGISFLKFRGITPQATYLQFEDRPQYDEVQVLADKYIGMFQRGEVDRVQVVYTRFLSASRQIATLETLLPMRADDLGAAAESRKKGVGQAADPSSTAGRKVEYEFVPNASSILEELVPASFKVRLFKCFLDAAVSEQISRMVAMKGATESAGDIIKTLTRQYNRARQAQITRELSEIIGGAAALE